MRAGLGVETVAGAIHMHPTLSTVVKAAFRDLGGETFVWTWTPSRTTLYVPVQTADEVAVLDHEAGEIVDRIAVGPNPYGATAARVRPASDSSSALAVATARLGLREETATTYCIGNCACGHEL